MKSSRPNSKARESAELSLNCSSIAAGSCQSCAMVSTVLLELPPDSNSPATSTHRNRALPLLSLLP